MAYNRYSFQKVEPTRKMAIVCSHFGNAEEAMMYLPSSAVVKCHKDNEEPLTSVSSMMQTLHIFRLQEKRN
jgi:hypothetical protein